jgi:hypothetical protein
MPNNYLTVDVWDWGNNTLRLMLTVFYEGKGKVALKQYFIDVPHYSGNPTELLMSLRNVYQEIQDDETIKAGQLAIKQLFEL